jgi:phage/plasmid primase-like uncharacterized protein
MWAGAEHCARTPAEKYLAERGVQHVTGSAVLRFRADTPHPEGGRRMALLGLVQDEAGAPLGLHRTYITPQGRKATCVSARASLGPIKGGAIRLDLVAPELVIGEGAETAASAGLLLGLPAWSAISAGNLGKHLVLPPEVRAVVIAADADEPGERAAREAEARWLAEGRRVRIARPRTHGQDFNDALLVRRAAEVANA